MDYKVRKGLETPLLIHGMLANYFYMSCALGGVLALAVFVSGSQLISGNISGFAFCVIVLFSTVFFFTVKFYFVKKSNLKALKFDNKDRFISNRDLIKSIK